MHLPLSRPVRRAVSLGIALTWASAFAHAPHRAEAQGAKKPGAARLTTDVAFPNLQFDRPVALAYPDDGGNLLFVVEQHQAKDPVVPERPRDRATSSSSSNCRTDQPGQRGRPARPGLPPELQGERPVLRLLLGPGRADRPTLGRLAVSRSRRTTPARPTRRARSGSGSAARPVREPQRRLHRVRPRRIPLHHAGRQRRGGRPARSTGQNPRDWFGSILRIDVDHPSGGKPYGIPADNPRLRDPEVRPVGPRGLRHRPAKRLEVHLRPREGHPLGRRRRPEPLGRGRHHRQWRQLRLEHDGRRSTTFATPSAAECRPGSR